MLMHTFLFLRFPFFQFDSNFTIGIPLILFSFGNLQLRLDLYQLAYTRNALKTNAQMHEPRFSDESTIIWVRKPSSGERNILRFEWMFYSLVYLCWLLLWWLFSQSERALNANSTERWSRSAHWNVSLMTEPMKQSTRWRKPTRTRKNATKNERKTKLKKGKRIHSHKRRTSEKTNDEQINSKLEREEDNVQQYDYKCQIESCVRRAWVLVLRKRWTDTKDVAASYVSINENRIQPRIFDGNFVDSNWKLISWVDNWTVYFRVGNRLSCRTLCCTRHRRRYHDSSGACVCAFVARRSVRSSVSRMVLTEVHNHAIASERSNSLSHTAVWLVSCVWWSRLVSGHRQTSLIPFHRTRSFVQNLHRAREKSAKSRNWNKYMRTAHKVHCQRSVAEVGERKATFALTHSNPH